MSRGYENVPIHLRTACVLDLAIRRSQNFATSQRIVMSRGLRAPLSPNEELALRRIASGNAAATDLSPRDVRRLRHLALVEDLDERLVLTGLGWQRHGHRDTRK
jgi:hypothetical protein